MGPRRKGANKSSCYPSMSSESFRNSDALAGAAPATACAAPGVGATPSTSITETSILVSVVDDNIANVNDSCGKNAPIQVTEASTASTDPSNPAFHLHMCNLGSPNETSSLVSSGVYSAQNSKTKCKDKDYVAELDLQGTVTDPWNVAELYARRTPDDVIQRLRSSRSRRDHRIADVYIAQNRFLEALLEPLVPPDAALESIHAKQVTRAVNLSLAANICLLVLQITAAVVTNSLSLAATTADSFMDLLSGLILSLTNWSASKENHLKYPTGKKRMQTVGLMLFACTMSLLSVFLMISGVKRIIEPEGLNGAQNQDSMFLSIGLILAAIATKLGLLLYCFSLRSDPAAAALVKDHGTDILVNTFALVSSTLASVLASKNLMWIDPVGALFIGVIILVSWVRTAWENVQLIVGRSAPPEVLNRLTYIAATHDNRVQKIDTCRAYWLGHNMFVEIDIVLPPNMSLRESHDIGESLQMKIETIPEVERAFVHCDYEFEHRAEH